MKVKHILIINAVVLLVFGIGFLFAPVWTMALFDISLDTSGIVMTQLLAAAFLGFAVLDWMGRNYAVADDVLPLIVANFVASAVGFVVAVLQRLAGVGNVWVWVPIVLYLLFALAFGYSLLNRATYEEPTMRTKQA